MARFYTISVQIEGRRYTGDWELRQGGEVCVGSAWGSDKASAGRRKPELVAAEVLRKVVADWQAKREREARQIARETERVARTGRPRNPKARP